MTREDEMEMKEANNKGNKGKKILKYVLVILLALICITAGGAWAYLRSLSGDGLIEDDTNVEDGYEAIEPSVSNLLILGLDSDTKTNKRSDTNMILAYDTYDGHMGLVSIPRDTRVQVVGRPKGKSRINSAHSYGGPQMTVDTIEDVFHVDIDHYVTIDYDGLKKIVDDLGGIEIEIPQSMNYDDNAGNLHIHFEEGKQTLNGQQAMEFLRYRGYKNADIGRINAQQEFIKAALHRLKSPSIIIKIPSLLKTLSDYVVTDLSPTQILSYIPLLKEMDVDNMENETIPGEAKISGGAWYFYHDKEETKKMIDSLIKNINPIENEEDKAVKIRILDGCGDSEFVKERAEALQEMGFNIVEIGQADNADYKITEYIDNVGDMKKLCAKIANSFGVGQYKLEKRDPLPEGEEAEYDLTVIIGKNAIEGEE